MCGLVTGVLVCVCGFVTGVLMSVWFVNWCVGVCVGW